MRQPDSSDCLYGPRGLPAPVAQRLHRALRTALADAGVQRRLADLGAVMPPPDRTSPEAHQAFWTADVAKWRPLIQVAGQYAD